MDKEPSGKYYGEDSNVIGEVILSRLELFLRYKFKTHATTNLKAIELEERYGEKVRFIEFGSYLICSLLER